MPEGSSVSQSHPQSALVLGFDFGLRRTGVAVGQTITRTARPLTCLTVASQQMIWPQIDRLVTEWQPQCFIVGQPASHNNQITPFIDACNDFAETLKTRYHRPVVRIDEQLTSRYAESQLIEERQQGRRRRIRKPEIDARAAALIVETWLSETSPEPSES